MSNDYAVVWRENGGPPQPGRLELEAHALRLEGGGDVRRLSFAGMTQMRNGRLPDERLAGRPALVVESDEGDAIQIATVGEVGALFELAERIAGAQTDRGVTAQRLVVVVPLKAGARNKVRRLLDTGPPFDVDTSGLHRHDVFLTDREAIFLFEAPSSAHAVERLLGRPGLWKAAARWGAHLAGPPRVAEAIYTWERPAPLEAALSAT